MIRWVLLKKASLPLALALVAGLGVSHYWAFQKGQEHADLELLQELDNARMEQARLVDELEQAQQARKVVYRDRVRTVYREPDPSGCAAARVPDGVLGAFNFDDRPETDGTPRSAHPAGADQP